MALSKNDYMVAGAVSGLVSRAVVQPLDVLKIRFQLQVEPISDSGAAKYHGFMQAIRCINKEEGAVAFWKGHIPAQLQGVTFSAIQFLAFEMLVANLVKADIGHDPRAALKASNGLQTFSCGCIAGSVAACVTQPLDVLRTRFIAQGEPKLYRSLSHAAVWIASREGIVGFFRGLAPSLMLVAPQTGLQFAIYHTFNRITGPFWQKWEHDIWADDHPVPGLDDRNPTGNSKVYRVGPVQSIVAGGLAGMGAKCIIYPLDMVKKRMQIKGFEEARLRFGKVPTSGTMLNCLRSIWLTEGATALFKGLRPTLLKSCVSIACRFTVYEQVCQLLLYIRGTDNPRPTC